MIEKIREIYGEFSDSWISKVEIGKKEISIFITCANKLNNFKYETIKVSFIDTVNYKIDTGKVTDSYAVKDTFIEIENGYILFDFNPIDYYDYLKENDDSKFKIKCKKVAYEFIEFYQQ